MVDFVTAFWCNVSEYRNISVHFRQSSLIRPLQSSYTTKTSWKIISRFICIKHNLLRQQWDLDPHFYTRPLNKLTTIVIGKKTSYYL